MKEMGQYMHLALQQDAEGLSHPLPRPNNVTADASRIRDVLVVDSNGLEQGRDPGICSPSAQRDEVGEIPRLLPPAGCSRSQARIVTELPEYCDHTIDTRFADGQVPVSSLGQFVDFLSH